MTHRIPVLRGRGAPDDVPNRFERLHVELDPEERGDPHARPTRYYRDHARSVLSRNDSPDIPFTWSLNPYRGCTHGCVYCYARPTHEYLGFSPGLDFESRILVKEDAPDLLARALARPSWTPTPIVMSGVTDPYQNAERTLRVTRRCLELLARTRHPVSIITKSRMVERDVDLLGPLAEVGAVQVTLSVTTLDRRLQRALEPRASPPEHRLAAIRTLSGAGVPVAVNVAPVIPGLTDHEIPAILQAAAEAGATHAGWTLLRLPGAVSNLFFTWLEEHLPDRAEKVRSRLLSLRGGVLNRSEFGARMRGEGPFADSIRTLFSVAATREGLARTLPELRSDAFLRPVPPRSGPGDADPQLAFF